MLKWFGCYCYLTAKNDIYNDEIQINDNVKKFGCYCCLTAKNDIYNDEMQINDNVKMFWLLLIPNS